MGSLETWEMLSYVVTVIGLPLAILVFIIEQRKERDNEEEEVYQLLSDNYQEFLRTALEHADLHLFSSDAPVEERTREEREKVFIIYSMLVSLFERAYLLLHERDMSPEQQRRWRTWEDYMREWCQRSDFREMLPILLDNEAPEFVAYIESLAGSIRVTQAPPRPPASSPASSAGPWTAPSSASPR